jgi:hypothetical protein
VDAVIVDGRVDIGDNAPQNLCLGRAAPVDGLGPRGWNDAVLVGRPLGGTCIGWSCTDDTRAVGFLHDVRINDRDRANAEVSQRLDDRCTESTGTDHGDVSVA